MARRRPWPAVVAAHWPDTVLLALLALLVAAPGLGRPPLLVLDELYYVSDAISFLDVGVARSFAAHPPLGTWLIALGIEVGGGGPTSWRLAALVAAVGSAVLLHRLALRLLPPTTTGRLSAASGVVLLVFDGSWLVLGRTAMLDGPLTMLVLAATTAAAAATPPGAGWRRPAWVLVAGAAAGAAMSVKWSGAVALLLIAMVLTTAPTGDAPRRTARVGGQLLLAAVTAGLVYSATWVPYAAARADMPIATCPPEAAPCGTTGGLAGVVQQHASLVRYHRTVTVETPAAAPPSSWPLMRVPVTFFHPDCNTAATPLADPLTATVPTSCGATTTREADTIVFSGNPVLWFGFLVLLPPLAGAARRDRAALVAAVGWAIVWAPWLVVTRTSYLWYLAPAIPFAALGLVATLRRLPETNIARAYTGGAIGALAMGALALIPGVPAGAVLLGWGLGGAVAGPLVHDSTVRDHERVLLVSLATAAGVVVGVFERANWVIGPFLGG